MRVSGPAPKRNRQKNKMTSPGQRRRAVSIFARSLGGGGEGINAPGAGIIFHFVRSAAPGDRVIATTWVEGTARHCRIEAAESGELFLGARFEG